MKQLIVFLVALLTAVAISAQQPAVQHRFASVGVEQFADTIKTDSVILVDVRTPQEYAAGHIEGSVNVVWGKQFDDELSRAKLDKRKVIAVYCRSGKRSKMAGDRLVEKGYRVVDLDGGITAWQKAARPVAIEQPKAE